MSEATDSSSTTQQQTPNPISDQRILWLMATVVILGVLLSLIFISSLYALGFLIGGILSVINYYWLKSSLKKMFVETVDGEHKVRYSAIRYVSRYLTLALILAVVFLTETVPVSAVIFGLASFAFAMMIQAFIRIFSSFFKEKEI